jgi:hypothetical protein
MFQHRSRAVLNGVVSLLTLSVLALPFTLGPGPGMAAAGHEDNSIVRSTTLASSLPVAVPGYTVSVFAAGSGSDSQPDPIIVSGRHVYAAYANKTAKDGTDHKSSSIVSYGAGGTVDGTWSVQGHCDGLRMDPATGLLWATANEDGNPALYTIDAATGAVTQYAFPTPPHGGGYDDLFFTQGRSFIAASNPTLDKNGVNMFPAIDQVALQNGSVVLTPVLMGNATALDTTTKATAPLNEVDPDSLAVDDQGNLVLVNQGGSELVFLSNPGTAQQSVSRVPTGTQLDDTLWTAGGPGRLFVADSTNNAIYMLRANFTAGTVYTAVPGDSGVGGFVGTVDISTGNVTPIATGFGSPTGLAFVPDSQFGSGGQASPLPGMPTTGMPAGTWYGYGWLLALAGAVLLAGVSLRRAAIMRKGRAG